MTQFSDGGSSGNARGFETEPHISLMFSEGSPNFLDPEERKELEREERLRQKMERRLVPLADYLDSVVRGEPIGL